MNVIPVYAVPHAQRLQYDVVVTDRLFYIAIGYSRHACTRRIRLYSDPRSRQSAVVHHGHFRQLFHALADDVAHQPRGLFRAPSGHVDIERGNVESTNLHHLRTFHFLWHGAHGAVNLLVHFDEQQTHVAAGTERQCYYAGIGARRRFNVFQTGHLRQLTAHRTDHALLYLAGGTALCRHLHHNARNVNIGHQGNRYAPEGKHTERDDGYQRHRHGNGAVEDFMEHIF